MLDLNEILETDNIATLLNAAELADVSTKICDGIAGDMASMDNWVRKYEKALKLAKMKDISGDKTFPFVGASRVMMPYIMEAAIDFNAGVTRDILGDKDVCFITETGKSTDETKARADRVQTYVNYQVNNGIKSWPDLMDKAYLLLPIVGTFFKKNWFCSIEDKQKSVLVYPDKLVCDHTALAFEDLQRKTFEFDLSQNEVHSMIVSGQYVDIDMTTYEDCEMIGFQECHCNVDLDGDGYAEPYIVTIHKDSDEIVSIAKRFAEDDINYSEDGDIISIEGEEYFSVTTFIPDPNHTFMGMGWGILLCDLYETINTSVRQIIDAGTLQNTGMNSGFINQSIARGKATSRKQKGKVEMIMGQFTQLQGEGRLQDSIMNFPFAGASPSMVNIMDYLTKQVREMTMRTNIDANPNEAAELYLARLSQAMKQPTSIMARVYRGLTCELKRIYEIARLYESDEKYSEILNEEANVKMDFESVSYDICPTANPALGSEQEQIQRATLIKDQAEAYPVPGVYDVRYAKEEYYKALGLSKDKIDKLLPPPQPSQPDPIVMAQAQAAIQVAQAEQMKGQADMMSAQAKMTQTQIDMAKLPSEIEKTESETIKNLSSVEKQEADIIRDGQREQREVVREQFEMTKEAVRELDEQNKQIAIGSMETESNN